MCGIAGIVCLSNNHQPLQGYIEMMTDVLAHRGPDDAGFFISYPDSTFDTAGNNATAPQSWNFSLPFSPQKQIVALPQPCKLAFGHRRLAVIDVSAAGHQPMCNQNQTIWITYNGEIYNYIELRTELEKYDCTFITKTDTEVIIKAYETWGTDCLTRFNGMWSFVLFDKTKNLLFGSRDRTGVKPLYYYKDNAYFSFASEAKALRTLPFIDTGINQSQVFNYLLYGNVDIGGGTLFKDILELPPSHFFTLNLNTNQFIIENYFRLKINPKIEKFNSVKNREYIEEIRELTIDAIEKRFRSDIPIGFCLSGGIDSSSIVCLADEINKESHQQVLGEKLTAFTATNYFRESDESLWAQKVAKQRDITLIQTECTAHDMLRLLPEIIYYQDSPLAATGTYAQYKVMQAARSHNISVLIDGQGGDELFAGYNSFYTPLYFDLLRKRQFAAFRNEVECLKNSSFSLGFFAKSTGKAVANKLLWTKAKASFARWLKPELAFFEPSFFDDNIKNINLADNIKLSATNQLLGDYYCGQYLKKLLRWEDRCSMRFSIESRTPFADDLPLIEKLFSIPATYKIHNGWNKNLLRSAMYGVLPEEIRLRTDKMGYATPQDTWFFEVHTDMKNQIAQLPDATSFINKEKLLNAWDSIHTGNNSSLKLFTFRYLNFLLWQQGNSGLGFQTT